MTNGVDRSDLCQLEARLVAQYVPPLTRMDVVRAIDAALARFDTASVRTYVLVLVERIATDRLRAILADERIMEAH